MAKISEQQIKEQDIDWYCLINGRPAHIASMGGMIPSIFRERDILRMQQEMVAEMEPMTNAVLNDANIQIMIADGYEYLQDQMISAAIVAANRNNPGFAYLSDSELPIRLFASTFVEKARRGFRSFARKEDAEGNEYILIAEPVGAVEYEWRGLELEELICEQSEDGNSITF